MSEVNLPVIGRTDKRMAIAIGAGAIVVIVYGYRKYKADKAAATPTGPGIDQSTIDPATGFIYGSTQDAAALNSQAGYVNPADSSGGITTTGVTTSTTFANNAQWSQAATDYLTNTVGLDGATVSSALGKYLAGSPLDSAGQDIVHQAIAAEGQPPQGGINGFPPSIQIAPAVPPVTPTPTPQQAATFRGATFYQVQPSGAVYTVQNGKRYHVTHATFEKLLPQLRSAHEKSIYVLPSDPIFSLPNGGNI